MRYFPFAVWILLFSTPAYADIVSTVVVPAITALAGAAASSLFGKKPKEPKLPKTPTAPVADDATRRRQAEREMQRRYAGMGRAGTILSENNKLG